MLLYVLGSHGGMGARDGMRGNEAATISQSGPPLQSGDLEGQDVPASTPDSLRGLAEAAAAVGYPLLDEAAAVCAG
jgi:hypothetical protein